MSSPIVIFAATYWEVRKFIHALKMKKRDLSTYECLHTNSPILLRLSGIGEENARTAAEKMLGYSPALILSTGFAGALRKEIEAGDLILDIEKSEPKISKKIVEISGKREMPLHQGAFYTSAQVLDTKEKKISVAEKTNAIAVEMESDAIFQLCRKKKIPFCSFRSVSDTLEQEIPQAASSFDSNSQARIKFLKTFLTRPSDWKKYPGFLSSLKKAEKSLTRMLLDFAEELSKNKPIRFILLLLLLPQLFCGCSVWKKIMTREKKVLPKMLVLPFACENDEIGKTIAKGFMENMDKNIAVLDQKEFENLLSSISLRNKILVGGTTEAKLPGNTTDFASLRNTEQRPKLVISFSTSAFFKTLLIEESFRTKVRLETGLDYVVSGRAKEKILEELEAGNLKTAETAEMKLLELKSGEILSEEIFKQGLFEIVAPDRIGSKFAAKVKKKLKEIRKQAGKKEESYKKSLFK